MDYSFGVQRYANTNIPNYETGSTLSIIYIFHTIAEAIIHKEIVIYLFRLYIDEDNDFNCFFLNYN